MSYKKELIGLVLKTFVPQLFGPQEIKTGYVNLTEKDIALNNVKKKDGSVGVLLGTRETGKTELAYRYAEFLDRRTYAVSPEQVPPRWIERIKLEEIDDKVLPFSTVILDDLPAYASNRDYNNHLIITLERLIPMCRHDRKLHLIFCSQSAAQADKYILDCDIAFFKPLGLLMAGIERPHIKRIYETLVNEHFDGKDDNFIKRHAYMLSRTYQGLITISRVTGKQVIDNSAEYYDEDNITDVEC